VTREIETGSAVFNRLLGLDLEEQLTCEETDLEQPVVRSEAVNKLVCNIQGGGGSQVQIDHMQDAVKLGLEGAVDKYSHLPSHSPPCLLKWAIIYQRGSPAYTSCTGW